MNKNKHSNIDSTISLFIDHEMKSIVYVTVILTGYSRSFECYPFDSREQMENNSLLIRVKEEKRRMKRIIKEQ